MTTTPAASPLRLTLIGPSAARDVAVRLGVGTTGAELSAALGAASLWVSGRCLAPDRPALEQGLADGDLVGLDQPVPAARSGDLELLVVAGPGAGSSYPLAAGQTVVGGERPGAGAAGIPLPGAPHGPLARIEVDGAAVVVSSLGPELLLDGEPVTAATTWAAGVLLEAGPCTLALGVPGQPPRAATTACRDGTVALTRPPRLRGPGPPDRLDVPLPPRPRERTRVPLLAVLAPLVLAGLLFAWNPDAPQYLLFGLLSPVMVLGTALGDRRGARRDLRDALARYDAARARYAAAAAAVRARQERAAREEGPDPATVCRWTRHRTTRLWERRPGEPGWLRLRVGTADRAALVELRSRTYGAGAVPADGPAPDDVDPPLLRQVPVTVDLPAAGVLGVAGPAGAGAARWLLGQVAALHAPGEVRIEVLAPAGAAGWTWVRWLPHETVLATGDAVAPAVARLAEQIRGSSPDAGAARTVVVADEAARLRALPGWAEVLRGGAGSGVLVICLDREPRRLSEECRAVLHAAPSAVLEVTGQPAQPVRLDTVDAEWAERLARALAPLRLAAAGETVDGGLPPRARWRDLAGPVDPGAVAAAWSRAPHGRTDVVLGLTGSGPWRLDLAAEGPHALVAGTTGAGKSELLQTWIVALARANPPSALTLLLIDYKGGAAFGRCADLPHTVGMLTDLDPAGTARALASLRAELRRRESLLAAAGARDLAEYHHAGAQPLARLVIVVDEFAALHDELPQFVTGLVGIAQRGRSLGVHLILATQRPAGVVSADIRANTAIRIGLRMTDAGESLDVVDCKDAAVLPPGLPGRAVVRTAAGTRTAQAGWLGGGGRDRPGANGDAGPVLVSDLTAAIGPSAAGPGPQPDGPAPAGDRGRTDLDETVEEIVAAAGSRFPAPAPPWLPPLPDLLIAADLAATSPAPEHSGPGPVPVAVGRCDLPERQAQPPLRYDLARSGTLLVVGGPRSGRSAALRAVVTGLAAVAGPGDLHVHLADTGGSLQDLSRLPQAGVVAGPAEVERLVRLLDRLGVEVRRRRASLAQRGHADLTAWRAAEPGRAPAYLLLGIDGWHLLGALLGDVDHGAPMAALLDLLHDGPAAGLRAVVTSDRSALTGRLSALADHRWILRLADRADWGLAGIPTGAVPALLPPGRCLVVGDAEHGPEPILCQLGLAAPDGAVPTAVGGEPHVAPLRLDPLPERIGWAEAAALPRDPLATGSAGCPAPVAVGGDRLSLITAELTGGFLVAGPPGSGRSNALDVVALALTGRGQPVVRIGPSEPAGWPPPDRAAVLVDDAELLDEERARQVEDLLAARRPVVVAATPDAAHAAFRGLIAQVRRNRRGLLLSPRRLDGDLLGVSLGAAQAGLAAGFHPGRAVLVERGRSRLVQVPLAAAGP